MNQKKKLAWSKGLPNRVFKTEISNEYRSNAASSVSYFINRNFFYTIADKFTGFFTRSTDLGVIYKQDDYDTTV